MIFLQKYIILPYWANISVESFIHSAFSIDGQCDAGGIPHLQEPGRRRHEWKFYARAYHGDTIGLEEMALHIMNPPRTGHEGCGYEEVEMEKMILQTRCYLTIILLRLLPATTM